MTAIEQLVIDNIGAWTAVIKPKASAGKAASTGVDLYGVAKLRGLILDLAFRGQLTARDGTEEDAAQLFTRIKHIRSELVAEKKLKATKKQPDLNESETRFALPSGWVWTRFGDICTHNAGKTLDKGRNSGHPKDYLTTSNLYWGRFDLSEVRQMLIRDDELEKCTAKAGDLLICEGGEAGRAAVWEQSREICFQNHVHRARFFAGVDPHYVQRFFEHLAYSGEINNYRKGVGISNMSGKALASIPFVLAPLEEQSRITSKIDELMLLCDQLEAQQADSIEAHRRLVTTLLDALTKATEQEGFDDAWARISEHFDVLFTTEWSVDQLQRAILQMAVAGRLASHCMDEDPASQSFSKFYAYKEQLLAEKVIRRKSKKSTELDATACWKVPGHWELFRWCDISHWITYGFTRPMPHVETGIPIITGKNVNNSSIILETADCTDIASFETLSKKDKPIPGDILITKDGSIGRAAIVRNQTPICINQSVAVIWLKHLTAEREWLKIVIDAPSSQDRIAEHSKGQAIKHLSITDFGNMFCPMPPILEQQRIVAKVDELMEICDALKSAIKEAQQTQLLLADAITEQAVA